MTLHTVPTPPDTNDQRMWHVTVTVNGEHMPVDNVRAALERLNLEHPFLLEARYSEERAEIRYWEEAQDMATAAAAASAMWSDNAVTAQLPAWEVVGLQVLDHSTYLAREPLRSVPSGRIAPFA
ncbi:MAG TPA: hypothetical protein VGP37_04665 [Candidatus Nanopelagicales bacterium]|nr:hypothetical protein [Candidatus Nanopelagicales bacterium]